MRTRGDLVPCDACGAPAGALAAALVFGVTIARGWLTPFPLILGVVMSVVFFSVFSFVVFFTGDPNAPQSGDRGLESCRTG